MLWYETCIFLDNFDRFWWQFCIDTCQYRSWKIFFEIFYVGLTHFSLLLSVRKLGQLVKMLWYETTLETNYKFHHFWWQFCIGTCQYRSWKIFFEKKNPFDWRFLVWFWASENLSKCYGMKQLSRQFDISYLRQEFSCQFWYFWWQFCIVTWQYRSWRTFFENNTLVWRFLVQF